MRERTTEILEAIKEIDQLHSAFLSGELHRKKDLAEYVLKSQHEDDLYLRSRQVHNQQLRAWYQTLGIMWETKLWIRKRLMTNLIHSIKIYILCK